MSSATRQQSTTCASRLCAEIPAFTAELFYTAGFVELFSVKEDAEILNAKKAAFLASKVMQNFVVEKIEDIIDKNKKVKHLKLSGEKP